MKHFALGLLLLSFAAEAQQYRRGGRTEHRRELSRLNILPGGSRSSLVCTGELNGAFGQTITHTRGSSAVCQNADGSLTTLTSNQPRVQAGGLLIEQSSTNTLLRSQEFDNASWALGQGASQFPTVTANTNEVVDPFGTNLAEKVVFKAITGTQGSQLNQLITVTAADWSRSVYVRGSATTPTGSIWMQMSPDGITWQTTECTFVQDSWTRCAGTATMTATGWYMHLGHDCRDSNVTCPQSEKTVYVFGIQWELGAHATSYIKTEGSTVTRSADQATLANPLRSSDTAWCLAGTIDGTSWPSTNGSTLLSLGTFAGANSASLRIGGGTNRRALISVYDSTGTIRQLSNSAQTATGRNRIRGCTENGTLTVYLNNVSVGSVSSGAGTGVISTQPATVRIGDLSTGIAQSNAMLSDLCIGAGANSCQ